MLTFFLFVGAVSSAVVYSNSSTVPSSITSAATLPTLTAGNGGISFPTICPDPGEVCWRSGMPKFNYSSANFQNPYIQEGIFNNTPVEPALRDFCGSMFGRDILSYLNSEPAWPISPPITITEKNEESASFAWDFTYKASTPCCGTCSLFGGDVQVYYWPSTTAIAGAPNATATYQIVDTTGFVL